MLGAEELKQKAELFIRQIYQELDKGSPDQRISEVKRAIELTGTYVHTNEELVHGARMAWRNSNRCIGRLYWKSLIINDKRDVTTTKEVYDALVEHIDAATNKGKIIPTITIFPPKSVSTHDRVRIWNHQLIGYAGYVGEDGQITGDPKNIEITKICLKHGWEGGHGKFDLLPLLIQVDGQDPEVYALPKDLIKEVNIKHPDFPSLQQLGLKWYAVPIISDMVLEIGGILYPASPFNGWYMVTEIGSRNFGDKHRYNVLDQVADHAGIDRTRHHPLWKDKALVILNEAVHHSYTQEGVSIVDHHTASDQFMKFIRNERSEGREVNGDWTWIVPPMSGSATDVFHQEISNSVLSPNFYYNNPPYEHEKQVKRCPFHVSSFIS